MHASISNITVYAKVTGYVNELKGAYHGVRASFFLIGSADKLYGKGKIMKAQKKYAKAIYHLKKEAELSKKRLDKVPYAKADNLLELAKSYERLSDYKGAVGSYNQLCDFILTVPEFESASTGKTAGVDYWFGPYKGSEEKLVACALNGIEHELRYTVDTSKNHNSSSFLNEVKAELADPTTNFQVVASTSNLIKIIDQHNKNALEFAAVAIKYTKGEDKAGLQGKILHLFETASLRLGNLGEELQKTIEPLNTTIESIRKTD